MWFAMCGTLWKLQISKRNTWKHCNWSLQKVKITHWQKMFVLPLMVSFLDLKKWVLGIVSFSVFHFQSMFHWLFTWSLTLMPSKAIILSLCWCAIALLTKWLLPCTKNIICLVWLLTMTTNQSSIFTFLTKGLPLPPVQLCMKHQCHTSMEWHHLSSIQIENTGAFKIHHFARHGHFSCVRKRAQCGNFQWEKEQFLGESFSECDTPFVNWLWLHHEKTSWQRKCWRIPFLLFPLASHACMKHPFSSHFSETCFPHQKCMVLRLTVILMKGLIL